MTEILQKAREYEEQYGARIPREEGGFGCVVGNRADDDSGTVLLFGSPDGFHWHFNAAHEPHPRRLLSMSAGA